MPDASVITVALDDAIDSVSSLAAFLLEYGAVYDGKALLGTLANDVDFVSLLLFWLSVFLLQNRKKIVAIICML